MLSAILSGIVQWFLGLFGASDAERLGKAEVTEKDQKAQIQAQQEALNVQEKMAGMSDDAVDRELRSKWK